jgi:hypothetical protein
MKITPRQLKAEKNYKKIKGLIENFKIKENIPVIYKGKYKKGR